MIPLRLNLRNFMSYTDVHEPLHFDGIHVAVLTGDNGHGKSALLDAITWALWGRARARSVDELIHAGASEMEVEFEFSLDDQQYRVIRKRERRGKDGRSDLQFAVLGEDGYRPLTAHTITDTERLIERTLRMSYETFTSSSFVQQGRADSFTTSAPAERKRILAEILELGLYDELESRAKERFKVCEAQLADEKRLSQDRQQEIARRPEYQAELDQHRARLSELDQQVEQVEQQLVLARERVAQLDALQQQVDELSARLQRIGLERTRLGATLQDRCERYEQARSVLARGREIEAAAAELDQVRHDLERAADQQQQFLPLYREREGALRTLATEQARLEAEVKQARHCAAEHERAAAGVPQLQAELRTSQQQVARLRALETEHEQLQAQVASAREEAGERRALKEQLKKEMLELRGRIDELERLSTCPTCQRPMDARHKQRLAAEYQTQGVALRDQFRTHEATCHKLDAALAVDMQRLSALSEALRGREAAQQRLAQVESQLAHAQQAAAQVAGLQQELSVRLSLLQEERFAPEARQQVVELDRRLATLGYDEARHVRLRARAAELAGVDQQRQELEQARLSADHLQALIAELEASLRRLDEECQAEGRRRDQFLEQTARLGFERQQLASLEVQQAETRRARDETRDRCLFAQSKLDNCAFLERKQRESLARQDALRREQGVYGDLAYAFGRRGVQAMIIETAIPEIEEEANRILSRMTDGRMHVKFETQRDARSGLGTIETLDIKIADELGTRSYELFSGGEGFRVNFAIRIALSRLLARRAGTRLQTLVVDEGFGSQDQEGRERIVEAIQAIEPDFEKILVITHLEDLRDRFPVRIEVTKTPRGSTYSIV